MDRRVTLASVAEEAGVSAKTASHALYSGQGAKDTVQGVREAARKLGYEGKTKPTSGVLVATFLTDHTSEYVYKVADYTRQQLKSTREAVGANMSNQRLTDKEIRERFANFTENFSGGVLIFPDNPHLVLNNQRKRFPCIVVDEISRADLDATQVIINPEPGIREAVTVLKDKGHERFAFVGGNALDLRSDRRIAVFKEVLKDLELPDPQLVHIGEDVVYPMEIHGLRAVGELLGRHMPTAVFTLNDEMAMGLMSGLADRGIRVPEDLSVVGFGGSQISEYLIPRLSTIDPNPIGVGRLAGEMLTRRIEEPGVRVSDVLVPTRAIFRDSIGVRA